MTKRDNDSATRLHNAPPNHPGNQPNSHKGKDRDTGKDTGKDRGNSNGVEPRPLAILKGIVALACGQPRGLACFSGSRRGVLSSLVPLLALPLIAFVSDHHAALLQRLTNLLEAVCVLLAAPVLSHALAVRLGRGALWGRYIAASNWCQWSLPVITAVASVVLGGAAMAAGGTLYQAASLVVAVLLPYVVWLQWFVARHGLALNGPVAAALVVGVYLGTMAMVAVPVLAAGVAAGGGAPP